MGNPKAFLNISRKEGGYRPKEERVKDYNEVEMRLNAVERREQASRCMECGVPFATGAVRSATVSQNGRTVSIRMTLRGHMRFCR